MSVPIFYLEYTSKTVVIIECQARLVGQVIHFEKLIEEHNFKIYTSMEMEQNAYLLIFTSDMEMIMLR